MEQNFEVSVSEKFPLTKQELWTIITDVNEMKQWFFNNIEDFKPEVGFKTQFNVSTGERNFLHLWEIVEVIPSEKIVYNWKYENYEGDSFVYFEINEESNCSILKVTAKVVEPFTATIPEFTKESCTGGWNYFIKESLKNYIESKK